MNNEIGFNPSFDSEKVISFQPTFHTNNISIGGDTSGGGTEPVPRPEDVYYEDVIHKPRINGVTLIGDRTPEELGLEKEMEELSFADIKEIWDGSIGG